MSDNYSEDRILDEKLAAAKRKARSRANVVELPKPKKLDIPGFNIVSAADFSTTFAESVWFIKGVLPKAELGMIYGASGAGKSFIVLDMLMAVALGTEWNGHRVKQGKVLYVSAEGAGGFAKRLQAYSKHTGADLREVPFSVLADAPNLLTDQHLALSEAIIAAGNFDLIVIDTLAQTTPGGNENGSEDMGKALSSMKAIAAATGAMIIPVHHSGKDEARGSRGWSGLKGAMDAELEVSREGDDRRLKVTKLKDGIEGTVYEFTLTQIHLGYDSDGDPVNSCVVTYRDAPAIDRKDFDGSGQVPKLLSWMLVACKSGELTDADVLSYWRNSVLKPGEKNWKNYFEKRARTKVERYFTLADGFYREKETSDCFSTT